MVANPTAGEGKAGRLIGRVNAILDEIGVDHEIRVSSSAEEMGSLARGGRGTAAASSPSSAATAASTWS